MLSYLLNRIFSGFLVLLVVTTITFVLMHSIPGGPFTAEKALPPAVLKNIEARYHLNDPLWKQYVDFLINAAQGDLGPSFKYESRTVNDIIGESFPVSAQLGCAAILFSLCAGIPAGVVAAWKRDGMLDRLLMLCSTIGISAPSFIIATFLVYVFALKIPLLPVALWEGPEHMLLPVIALASLPTAVIARLIRSEMLEALQQDYIRTARAKGASAPRVLFRHALPNALLPVLSYLGPLSAGILTGSFVIENLFAIPGLGRHYVTSIYNRDYTVILGVTLFYSALLILLNILVDLLYAWADPRIKLADAKGDLHS